MTIKLFVLLSPFVKTNQQLCTAFTNYMFINVVVTSTCFGGQAIVARGHQRLQVHYASKVVKYFIDAVDRRSVLCIS
jgi:hypothetical protein